MSATWKFITVRADYSRRNLRRQNGKTTFTGTSGDALDFAARALAYLQANGVVRVEAWSCGRVEGETNNEKRAIFRIRRHENGRDWRAEVTELHHGGWNHKLEDAIGYAMFRGAGRICEIQICNRAGAIMFVVLADQRGREMVPCTAPRLK
jgi:hypothetical protein